MNGFYVYINDLSLNGFTEREQLGNALIALFRVSQETPNLKRILYCSRQTALMRAIPEETLIQSVSTLPRDTRNALLLWLNKRGPFMDDDRTEVEDDLFYFQDHDVTDQGLGEAARQHFRGNDGRSFSFIQRRDINFSLTPLNLVHGLREQPSGTVEVSNFFDLQSLRDAANAAVPEPENWPELLETCRNRFTRLKISSHCDEVLSALPFFPTVARRTLELLKVLDELKAEITADGALSLTGEEIRQRHFVGNKAWFTDESDDNKNDFGREMTFPDPSDGSRSIQCFWHGKIKTPQFRIHFEWPLKNPVLPLKVAYIGPKISKR